MGGSAERDVMAHCVPFQRPCQKPLLWLHPQDWNHKMKRPGKARFPKHLERILRESVPRDGFGSAVTTSRDCPGAVGRGCAGDALSLTASLASGGAPSAGTADGAELKGVETAPWVMGASGEAGKPRHDGVVLGSAANGPGQSWPRNLVLLLGVLGGRWRVRVIHVLHTPGVTLPLAALEFQQNPGNLGVERAASASRAPVPSLQKEL